MKANCKGQGEHKTSSDQSSLFAYILTLKFPTITAADSILKYLFFFFFFFFFNFFDEKKSWHFMWIICQTDNIHEMSRLFSLKTKKQKKKPQKTRLSSATNFAWCFQGKGPVSHLLTKDFTVHTDHKYLFLWIDTYVHPWIHLGWITTKPALLQTQPPQSRPVHPCTLTHLCLASHKRDTGKQCRTHLCLSSHNGTLENNVDPGQTQTAECGIWSGYSLFALSSEISTKHDDNKN